MRIILEKIVLSDGSRPRYTLKFLGYSIPANREKVVAYLVDSNDNQTKNVTEEYTVTYVTRATN